MWGLLVVAAIVVVLIGLGVWLYPGEYRQMQQRQRDHARQRREGKYEGQPQSRTNPDTTTPRAGGF